MNNFFAFPFVIFLFVLMLDVPTINGELSDKPILDPANVNIMPQTDSIVMQNLESVSSEDRKWYPGINMKKGDFFSYNASHASFHHGNPFEFHVWIQGETETTWNAVFTVLDEKNIDQKTVVISKDNATFVGIHPSYYDVFSGFYRSGPAILASNFDQLTPAILAPNTQIGVRPSIGNPPIYAHEFESVLLPAGFFDAVKISWKISESPDELWVDPSLPFPIKGKTMVPVAAYIILAEFELIDFGNTEKTLLSPLKQQQIGIPPDDIRCKENLVLMLRPAEISSACVTVNTAKELQERDWIPLP